MTILTSTGRSRFVQARGLCWGGMSHGEGHTHILAISCTTHMGDGGGLEPTPDLVLALAAEALAALGGIELDSPRTLREAYSEVDVLFHSRY